MSLDERRLLIVCLAYIVGIVDQHCLKIIFLDHSSDSTPNCYGSQYYLSLYIYIYIQRLKNQSTINLTNWNLCMKRNFAMRSKTDLGPRGQAEASLKIEDLRANKTA